MIILLALIATIASVDAVGPNSVVFALNAGGPAVKTHTGVLFQSDEDAVTTAFPKGISAYVPIGIERVLTIEDAKLYQTERYGAQSSFGYSIRTPQPGDYVLVLKFAEVYWHEAAKKLFDIRINGKDVVRNLDIFGEVGFVTAFVILVPLTFTRGELIFA
jgi:hypothetical protein